MMPHQITLCGNDDPSPKTISFRSLSELDPAFQFLLCCGPFNDLEKAKAILPTLLSQLPTGSSIADLRMAGVEFRALDWAARKGNHAIVEWFCTDPRLAACLRAGAPIAWACYTNHVDVARLLLRHGADPHATDPVFFGCKPPLLGAAEAGHLLALQWLVDEGGQDARVVSPVHGTLLQAIREPLRVSGVLPPGNRQCLDWALARAAP
jgi:hypothetical protein